MRWREDKQGVYVTGAETEDVNKYFTFQKQIGQPGQFGVAKIAVNKGNGQKYVIKIIKKARFQKASADKRKKVYNDMKSEIDILVKLDSDLIIKLYDVYEDKFNLYLVTELCSGGELFDAISAKGTYSEKECAQVVRQIFEALNHLHSHDIAHCDLKPDNFLFKTSKQKILKVIDFGMAKRVSRRDHLTNLVGTPYYTAPEVLDHKYHTGADIWSIGVVMFVMLFGYPPFYVNPQEYPGRKEAKAIYRLIKEGFTEKVQDGYGAYFPKKIRVSANAKDLIAKCLTTDVKARPTALEALAHPWFHNASDVPLPHFKKPIPELHIKSFRNFQTQNEFHTAACAIFAEKFSIMDERQKASVTDTFKNLDLDGDGVVSLEEFTAQMGKTDLFQGEQQGDLEDLFKALDIDGDSSLNVKELMASVVGSMVKAREERLWEGFLKFDTDSSGTISKQELKIALDDLPPGLLGNLDLDAVMTAADVDGDGQISWQEFLNSLDPEGASLRALSGEQQDQLS